MAFKLDCRVKPDNDDMGKLTDRLPIPTTHEKTAANRIANLALGKTAPGRWRHRPEGDQDD